MRLEEKLRFLAACPFFRGLGDPERRAIAAHSTSRAFRPGQMLFGRGERDDVLSLIVEGWVSRSLTASSGKEILLDFIGVGDVIGDLGFVDGGQWEADYIAVEKTAILRIDHARLRGLRGFDTGTLGHQVGELLSRRTRTLLLLVEELALHGIEDRLALLLWRLQTSPGGGTIEILNDRLSQSALATMANASRSRVNQLLRRFERLGLLQLRGGRLAAVRPEAIQSFLESRDARP